MLNTTPPFAVGTYSACHAALQGIKLELFIFDTFPMASKVSLLEVRLSPRTHIPQPALSGFCIPTQLLIPLQLSTATIAPNG